LCPTLNASALAGKQSENGVYFLKFHYMQRDFSQKI
tara:strand:+ start:1127 stop:1234 length:108 start_codon:yes stop_codon:yes gene_type:complete